MCVTPPCIARRRKMLLSSLCLLVVYIHLAATANITITSSPKLGADTVLCLNESVTLTCHTHLSSIPNITWLWLNQSEHGETITVMAELTVVMYTCIVSDDGKYMGQASITIIADGSAPIVTRENFRYCISRTEGSNLTLTTTVTSNLPISSGYPVWKVLHDQPLPPTAKVINYTIDGVMYNNLSLYDLSYNDDTGNYTYTASNECGTSSVFTFIGVTKAPIMCNNSGSVAIPLHNVTTIVQGDFVQISCIFRGNLDLLGASLTSYWSVNPPPAQHSDVSYITDNTTDPYRKAVYQTCLTSEGSCCNFTNQLTILSIPSSLNDYKLSCVESLNTAGSEPTVHTNTTSIIVLMIPRILRGPIKVNDDQSKIMLQCQFNASAIPGVTVVVWKRNDIQLFNSTLYQIRQESGPGVEDQVVSTLTINSSNDYYGTYTCYCYYNRSLVTSSKPIASDPKSLTLQRSSGGNKQRISRIEVFWTGAGSLIIVAMMIEVVVLFIISKYRRASSTLHVGSDSSDQSTKTLLSLAEEKVGPQPCPTSDTSFTNMYPPDTDHIIGCVETATFDERGGKFHSYEHGVTVAIPSGAIPSGMKAKMTFAATLNASVKLSDNAILGSAMIWICLNVALQKPILLKVPHCVNVKSKANSKKLRFVKTIFHPTNNEPVNTMKVIKGGDFPVGESYGIIEIDHCCYYCIEFFPEDCPEFKYRVVAMKKRQPDNNKWDVHVAIMTTLPTCLKALREQYDKNQWYDEEIIKEFPFDCEKISCKLNADTLKDLVTINPIAHEKDVISKDQVDFRHAYKNEKSRKFLQLEMEERLSPQRLKFEVFCDETNKHYFKDRRLLNLEFIDGESGNVIVTTQTSVPPYPASEPEVSHTSRLAVKTDVSDEPPQIDMIILLLLMQTENIIASENDGWLEDVSELLKKIEFFIQLNDTELNRIYNPKLEPAHRSVCLHIVIKERNKTNEVSLLLYGIYYGNIKRQLQAKPNNEIMSSAAQQGSVQPQETHHHHNNISYNLHISLNVAADSALHRAEEFLLDTDNFDNPLRQHASDFMSMVNIAILPPVLFENDLLTSHDMEFLQLLSITDGDKIKFLYTKLLRGGEEGYKKFMECLQNPYAMQHDGHKELYQKLLKSQH